ncbi:antibiotic biosynthesis monooxygenase family protein [Nocardia miyunensis]|uniref:antibiotic biosynthesis monooxygenase family protein n=1 Tax=Nocardia miyunensis TaxID=282684 RepID=UPI0008363A49|nr:antibiotic biosynthesis monooxygenase [Nocardia miyunensis]
MFNIFTVRPENQRALIESITADSGNTDIPGLLGMRLLRSLDGTHVINHMHWETEAAMQTALRTDPHIAETRRRVGELIEGAQPLRFEIAAVLK